MSKLDLITAAQTATHTVALHVMLIPGDLAVHRVAHRVAVGGHSAPKDRFISAIKSGVAVADPARTLG